jgi:hypothetical protein
MGKIRFANGAWKEEELPYAYTHRFKETPKFTQLSDSVVNRADEAAPAGWEWISLLTAEKVSTEKKASVRFRFEGEAAPILLFADWVSEDENGDRRFGDYIEIVAWKNGVNVLQLNYDPNLEKDGGVYWKLLLGVDYKVDEREEHTITAWTKNGKTEIYMDDRHFTLHIPAMPKEAHIGLTACEGLCRFYEFELED